jgi:transcriptional regulator with XRE-family HTH domain
LALGCVFAKGEKTLKTKLETTRTTLGRRLRSDRMAMELSQARLAELSGLSMSAIAQIEGGQIRDINLTTCAKLAKALKCDPEWLAGWR